MSEPMTDRAAELLRLRAITTPGELTTSGKAVYAPDPEHLIDAHHGKRGVYCSEMRTVADAEFYAYAANHAAAIVAEQGKEIERLRQQLAFT